MAIQPLSRGKQEVAALLLLFLTLFLLTALLSYLLPLLKTPSLLQQPEENWCGAVGFYTAHHLFSFLGLVGFFPVLLLGTALVRLLFTHAGQRRLPMIVAGVSGMMFCCSGLFGGMDQLVVSRTAIAPGGHLGQLLWHVLSGTVGEVGAALVLALVLLFSLMASVQLSPMTLLSRLLVGKEMPLASDPPHTPEPVVAGRRSSVTTRKKSSVPESAPILELEPAPMPAVHEAKRTGPPPVQMNKSAVVPVTPSSFSLPSLELLDANSEDGVELSNEHYYETSEILVKKLQDFGVQGTVAGISPGPVVTTYEFSPAPGVKINRIVNLADDLAMVLKVDRVRIVGSIPGKAAIGIEIPNPVRRTVFLRDIISSSEYQTASSMLSLALGFDVIGRPVVANLARMPHLLIAGATGAGKSVAINAFIASILFKASPDDVRMLMIDPKRIELSVYDDIPHLLHPVVVEAKMASRALLWAVREMERRYRLLEERRVKSFMSYNQVAEEKLPYIVIIVDELADLMMVASKDVETSIARLAQMARAAGMHIILATQRPSVDVLTGLIKANFPTRISFKVSSKVDSRTILDGSGAEHLLGMGDMLFLPPGAAKLQRIHGAYISEQETERLVTYVKSQGVAEYDDSVLQDVEEEGGVESHSGEEEYDEKYDEAVAVVTETGQASISMVQRRLRVGYNRAARMIEIMEKEGIVGPADGSRPREVLVRSAYSGEE